MPAPEDLDCRSLGRRKPVMSRFRGKSACLIIVSYYIAGSCNPVHSRQMNFKLKAVDMFAASLNRVFRQVD